MSCGSVDERSRPVILGRGLVFGIGLSKTATHSLSAALDSLGIRCRHYPDLSYFVRGDFASPLRGYDAACDTPCAAYFRELDRAYPGSRFILTVRERGEWLRSCQTHFEARERPSDIDPSSPKGVVRRRLFGTAQFDLRAFEQSWQRHHDEVRAYFADRPSDLLVINICRDGDACWGELRSFLGFTRTGTHTSATPLSVAASLSNSTHGSVIGEAGAADGGGKAGDRVGDGTGGSSAGCSAGGSAVGRTGGTGGEVGREAAGSVSRRGAIVAAGGIGRTGVTSETSEPRWIEERGDRTYMMPGRPDAADSTVETRIIHKTPVAGSPDAGVGRSPHVGSFPMIKSESNLQQTVQFRDERRIAGFMYVCSRRSWSGRVSKSWDQWASRPRFLFLRADGVLVRLKHENDAENDAEAFFALHGCVVVRSGPPQFKYHTLLILTVTQECMLGCTDAAELDIWHKHLSRWQARSDQQALRRATERFRRLALFDKVHRRWPGKKEKPRTKPNGADSTHPEESKECKETGREGIVAAETPECGRRCPCGVVGIVPECGGWLT